MDNDFPNICTTIAQAYLAGRQVAIIGYKVVALRMLVSRGDTSSCEPDQFLPVWWYK